MHCLLEEKGKLENGAYYSQHQSPLGTMGGWPIKPTGAQANDNALATAIYDESLKIVAVGAKI